MPIGGNYDAITTLAIESLVQGVDWARLTARTHPLLCKLIIDGRVNTGFDIVSSPTAGTKAVGVLRTETLPVYRRSRDTLYNPIPLTPFPASALKMWEYNFVGLTGNYVIDPWQTQVWEKQKRPGIGRSFSDISLEMLTEEFYNQLEADIASDSPGGADRLMGFYYILPTTDPATSTNNVGNIGAYNALTGSLANWRPIYRNYNASLSPATILEGLSQATLQPVSKTWKEQRADLVLVPETATGGKFLYSRLLNTLGGQQRYIEDTRMVEYAGWNNIRIGGALVTEFRNPPDNVPGSNTTVYFLNSNWWIFGRNTDAPQLQEPLRVPGTPIREFLYLWILVFGCAFPGRQVIYANVT
jgi:hypothetical protein